MTKRNEKLYIMKFDRILEGVLHVTWILFMLSNMEMQKIQLVIEFVNCTFVLALEEYHQH